MRGGGHQHALRSGEEAGHHLQNDPRREKPQRVERAVERMRLHDLLLLAEAQREGADDPADRPARADHRHLRVRSHQQLQHRRSVG